MVLLCGIPSETPINRVREELCALGVPHLLFNQRRFSEMHLEFEVFAGGVSGHLKIGTENHALRDFDGIYNRLMDERLLPEIEPEPEGSSLREACETLHEALVHWCEIAPCRVVNRTAAMASNASKPYQAQRIRQVGFAVPDTLVTNDPDLVRAFCALHGRVVYKSISGVRSIVRTVHDGDLKRLEQIRWCPTQFQEFVEGMNVRVHTIGDRVFATAIRTDAIDYRYVYREGGHAELRPYDLSESLAERCIQLAAVLRLDFAGIDLKITPDGEAYCFEVNPSPAFTYYEAHTGQPIARAVARYLAGMRS